MHLNLETLRTEIQSFLESRGMVVFQSLPRAGDLPNQIFWDVARRPDYREFVTAAEAAGIRLVTLYAREFTEDDLDEADANIDATPLELDARRHFQARLK